MKQRIAITINGSHYDIDVEGAFAQYLQDKVAEDLKTEGNNDIKKLLQAYVRSTYALYESEQSLKRLLDVMNDDSAN